MCCDDEYCVLSLIVTLLCNAGLCLWNKFNILLCSVVFVENNICAKLDGLCVYHKGD